MADDVRLVIETNGDIAFARSYARDAAIDTTSRQLTIDEGWIAHTLRLCARLRR